MAKVKAEQKTWGYVKKKGERYYLYREIGNDNGKRQYAPSMIFDLEPDALEALTRHKTIMQGSKLHPDDEVIRVYVESLFRTSKMGRKKCMTVAELLTVYSESKLHPDTNGKKEWGPSTARSNKNLQEHIIGIIGDVKVDSLTEQDIKKYLNAKRKNGNKDKGKVERPLSENSLCKHFDFLRAAFSFAVEEGFVQNNPIPKKLRPDKTEPERPFYEMADAIKIITVAKKYRLLTLIALCFFLAIRRSEALGLTWQDIDFEKRTVHIQRARLRVYGKDVIKETKSKSSNRILYLDDTLTGILRFEKNEQVKTKTLFGDAVRETDFVVVNEIAEKYNPDSIYKTLI